MVGLIKILSHKKGDGNEYFPEAGETCLVSPPNCDDDRGYVYQEAKCLWRDNVFCLFQVQDCWPNIYKWDHIHCKVLPSQIIKEL